MRPTETLVAQSVRSLQTMLRVISEAMPNYPSVIPDGIYGPDTARSVTFFQQQQGLPVTGVTDQRTWEAIVSIYELALTEVLEPEPIYLTLAPGQIIDIGEENPQLFLVQAALTALSMHYQGVTQPSMSGILDVATAASISSFQQLARLPVTGKLDKTTWKSIALHYPLAINYILQP